MSRKGLVAKVWKVRSLQFLLAVLFFIGASTPLQADSISFEVVGFFGTGVTATIDFGVSCAGGSCTLTIAIENTSPVGGEITGFGFNLPSGVDPTLVSLASVSGSGVPSDGWNIFNISDEPNKTAADGLGTYSIAAVHGVALNDGNPPGVGVGETGTFTLTFSSSTVFTASDFLSVLSSCDFGGCGNGQFNFIARFQNVGPSGTDSDFAVIPEPGTLGLLGFGVAALALRRGRRRRIANG